MVMNRLAYERDSYVRELDTEVVEVGEDDDRPFAVTADTVFYPEGGGQPADLGTMGAADVVDVQKVDGAVRHHLSSPVSNGPIHQVLDWERRFDHMQQHTAQHLVTAIALQTFDWPTTAFHLGPVVSDIELDAAKLGLDDLLRLEDAVAAEISAARTVSIRYAPPDQMDALGVRSRLLPQDFSADELRLVEIEGVDLNTCGGTHVASTAEIGSVALLGTEAMRGGTRVFFVAGRRVRRRMRDHERRNARLRGILDSADDDLPEVVELRIGREKQLARERRRLLEDLAEAESAVLSDAPEDVVVRHWDDRDMDFLQRLARRLVEVAPAKAALLTAGSSKEGFFIVSAGDAAPIDLTETGREIAAILDGRGGGAKGVFQGRAADLTSSGEAAAALRSRYTDGG
jgi:alanyl-tRNA synthetase